MHKALPLFWCRGGFIQLGLNKRLLPLHSWHVSCSALLEGIRSRLAGLVPWARELLNDLKLCCCQRGGTHIPSSAWGILCQCCNGISGRKTCEATGSTFQLKQKNNSVRQLVHEHHNLKVITIPHVNGYFRTVHYIKSIILNQLCYFQAV